MKTIKCILLVVLLTTASDTMLASVPPHPRVKEMIKEKKITVPYYLKNRMELLQRGVNAPWASPEIQNRTLGKKGRIQRSLGSTNALSGSWRGLVILVKFSDMPDSTDPVLFDSLLFGNSTGTLKNYCRAVSYNALDIVTVNMPSSIGWVTAPQTYAYYTNSRNGMGAYPNNSQKLVEDVIPIIDSIVDFSKYDNDGDTYVDALFVVHTGPGAEFTGSDNDIWSHAWNLHATQLRDGVHVFRYSIEPEFWETPGDMTCGVYAHEFGHSGFGLPDLYDTDNSSEGLGNWSVMAGGSWCGAAQRGESPSFPDAWSHFQMGYLDPTNVTLPLINQSIHNTTSTPEAYRLWTYGNTGNQYFLVQNRQKTGYDTYLPNSGLLIFHVDESVYSDNSKEWYPGHTSTGHYLVALEQADSLYQLEKNVNRGNSGDPYPGSINNRNFNSTTFPGSNNYLDVPTKVSVENISNSGSVMTADLKVGFISSDPYIVVTPDTIDSKGAFIGISKYDTVFVENAGLDPLVISNITSSLPQYTPNTTSFTVAAGSIQLLIMTFLPTDTTDYIGQLTLTSNDPLSGTKTIPVYLSTENTTGINDNDKEAVPTEFTLHQNYPNPFNPSTKIAFSVPSVGTLLIKPVQLKIFDILGREIVTLVNGMQTPGEHTIQWDGKNSSGQPVGSGVYVYTLQSNDIRLTKKLLLLK